jgi:hypothetical protein
MRLISGHIISVPFHVTHHRTLQMWQCLRCTDMRHGGDPADWAILMANVSTKTVHSDSYCIGVFTITNTSMSLGFQRGLVRCTSYSASHVPTLPATHTVIENGTTCCIQMIHGAACNRSRATTSVSNNLLMYGRLASWRGGMGQRFTCDRCCHLHSRAA